MSPSEEKIASIMSDVNKPKVQEIAKALGGSEDAELTEGVPTLTGQSDYHAWWSAMQQKLKAGPKTSCWEAMTLAINDDLNLMDDEEIDELSDETYEQHVTVKAFYLLQSLRIVKAIRATMSPELNQQSRGAGNQPFTLLWWIQSRFAEGRVEEMTFMPELLQDLDLPKSPQQRTLEVNESFRDWDDWNGFDMDRIALLTYGQLTGNVKGE